MGLISIGMRVVFRTEFSVRSKVLLRSNVNGSSLLAFYFLEYLCKKEQILQSSQAGVAYVGKPGILDIAGRQKWTAWMEHKGKDKETAMREYIA